MDESMIGILIFGGVIAILVVGGILISLRYGSLRGAMFGARVTREVGMVESKGNIFSRCLKARVFELEADGRQKIGLELGVQGKRSYATLDADGARKLAELLQHAARRG